MNHLYPLMLNMANKKVAIVGGGRIALRKAQGLAGTGAQVTVISPDILPELLALPYVLWLEREFFPESIQHAHLVYAATNNKQVNQQIAQYIADWQWFNDVSCAQNSSFHNPAVIRKPHLVLSISTEGRDPSRAKQLKEQLNAYLEQEK